MARLFIQSEGANIGAHELKWGVTRVGRGSENDVVIPHSSVSFHHCEMELGLDFLNVRDCNSTNGTFVNDSRVTEARLDPGQTLRLGEVCLIVEWSRQEVTVPPIAVAKRPESVSLGEEVWSCLKHATIPAAWHCSKCDKLFCQACTRDVHLVGRLPRKLCPVCSTPVDPTPWADGRAKKKSIWGRIKKSFSRTARVR